MLTLLTVAVVFETEKSAASTFCTSSSNVTRQVTLSASVGEEDGVLRVMDAIVGAVVSDPATLQPVAGLKTSVELQAVIPTWPA